MWQALGGGETGGKSEVENEGNAALGRQQSGPRSMSFLVSGMRRGSDPLAHLHAVSGGAGAAIGVGKRESCSEQMSHLQVPVIAKTLFSKAIKFCFGAMPQQTKTDSRF